VDDLRVDGVAALEVVQCILLVACVRLEALSVEAILDLVKRQLLSALLLDNLFAHVQLSVSQQVLLHDDVNELLD